MLKKKFFQKRKELNAIPYDIPGTEYPRYDDECTFDFIIKNHYCPTKIIKG